MHQMSATASSPLQPDNSSSVNGASAAADGSASALPPAGGSSNAAYGAGDVRVLVNSASSSGLTVAGRERSDTIEQIAPWDAHDGGGIATYLPAPPSPRTPALAGPTRRKGARDSPAPSKKNMLVVPPALGLGVQAQGQSPQAPLLSRAEQADAAHTARPGDEIHADDVHADELSMPFSVDSTGEHPGADDADEGVYDDDDEDAETHGVPKYQPPPVSHSHKLGQWMATGICGNDITSSILYVTGLCVADAGIWAPLCLMMVVFTLYLFRKIYGEAVTALPLNGGAYNVLLSVQPAWVVVKARCCALSHVCN